MRKQEIHKAIQFAMKEGFQKGKLEERKRIRSIIEKWRVQLEDIGFITIDKHFVDELQKEIGEEKQDE